MTCDASAVAVGAVLSQLHDGIERPIAFASRALSTAEQKYSVGEREALACIWACERWHMYLYGRSFTLRTDHQALTTLMSSAGTGHRPLRLHRWADRLNLTSLWLSTEAVAFFHAPRPLPFFPPACSLVSYRVILERLSLHCSSKPQN